MSDDGEYSGPRYAVTDLTDDQHAMLALMGGLEAGPRRSVAFWSETHPALLKVAPTMSQGIVKDHVCPIVEYRGALRVIFPNGDVSTVNNDPPTTET